MIAWVRIIYDCFILTFHFLVHLKQQYNEIETDYGKVSLTDSLKMFFYIKCMLKCIITAFTRNAKEAIYTVLISTDPLLLPSSQPP